MHEKAFHGWLVNEAFEIERLFLAEAIKLIVIKNDSPVKAITETLLIIHTLSINKTQQTEAPSTFALYLNYFQFSITFHYPFRS